MDKTIIYNALQTPDGTILHSKHRHDYIEYKDTNGNVYVIDGGNDYVRCSCNGDEVFLTKYFEDCTFEECANYMCWGSNYDKDMNRLPKTIWKKICELDTNHIEAILDGNFTKNEKYIQIFEYEINRRKQSQA
jgi:hypothetical protein